jgi:hypothetical protein
MAYGVQRDPIGVERDVRAVIGVEATEEVLLRLRTPGMLHREEPRNRLEDFFGA